MFSNPARVHRYTVHPTRALRNSTRTSSQPRSISALPAQTFSYPKADDTTRRPPRRHPPQLRTPRASLPEKSRGGEIESALSRALSPGPSRRDSFPGDPGQVQRRAPFRTSHPRRRLMQRAGALCAPLSPAPSRMMSVSMAPARGARESSYVASLR